jgi:hypothetical protein
VLLISQDGEGRGAGVEVIAVEARIQAERMSLPNRDVAVVDGPRPEDPRGDRAQGTFAVLDQSIQSLWAVASFHRILLME